MDINVRVMQEGEVARQVDNSTVIAEEGQVMLSISGDDAIAIALLNPEDAYILASSLTTAGNVGMAQRRVAATLDRIDKSLWSWLTGATK